MKKITIITNGTLPVPATKGGAVENLINIFLDFNENKNDLKIQLFSIYDSKAKELSYEYKNTEFIFINDRSFLYKLSKVFRYGLNRIFKNKFKNQFISKVLEHKDIIASSDLILVENNPFFLKHIRKTTSIPIGLHLHNDYLNIENQKSKKILESVDFVITVSNYIKNRVEEIAPKHLKVLNVYNGIDLRRFNNGILNDEKAILKKKFNIEKDDVVIVFSGRLQEHKGINVLINAFVKLSNEIPVKLLIIGGFGFGDVKMENLKKILGINEHNDRIILTGYVEYSDIHKYYALGDFAVLPSLCEEAFPLTTLEAMASGLPVIITDSGGMPESINSKCGIIINKDINIELSLIKEMELLINDEEQRSKMSKEARKQASKFSNSEYYSNMVKCINLILE